MKKAIIIYQSKKGTTQQLGNEIKSYLSIQGMQTEIISVENIKNHDLSEFDYVFLGCWTKGLMFFAQHPDQLWKNFVNSIVLHAKSKIALFTTYKIATGSMFSQMRKNLPGNVNSSVLEIKSRDGSLRGESAEKMGQFIL